MNKKKQLKYAKELKLIEEQKKLVTECMMSKIEFNEDVTNVLSKYDDIMAEMNIPIGKIRDKFEKKLYRGCKLLKFAKKCIKDDNCIPLLQYSLVDYMRVKLTLDIANLAEVAESYIHCKEDYDEISPHIINWTNYVCNVEDVSMMLQALLIFGHRLGDDDGDLCSNI